MMRLTSPYFNTVLSFEENVVPSLILEAQDLFYKTLNDIIAQIEGNDGEYRFSIDFTTKPFHKHVEILQQWVPFDLNTKPLLTAFLKLTEKEALARDRFTQTHALLNGVQRCVRTWTLTIPHEAEIENLTVTSLLKACGLKFATTDYTLPEQILSYVRLVRELIGEKLFIFVNLRAYLSDTKMEQLLHDLIGEKFNVLLLETVVRPKLSCERRLIIDQDLCEIGWNDGEI